MAKLYPEGHETMTIHFSLRNWWW